MGMDLVGQWRKTTPQEIKDKHEYGAHLHYNWTGWSWITSWLEERGVDMSEFRGSNDGERLSRKTCKAVAEALEQHWDDLSKEDQKWLKTHVEVWKHTLNFQQY